MHHSGGYNNICEQIQNISAFSATNIIQTFNLVTDQSELTSRGPQVQTSLSAEGASLRAFFAESHLDTSLTSMEWVDLMAQHMEIQDKSSSNLLVAALTDSNSRHVYEKFESRGYDIEYTPDVVPGELFHEGRNADKPS